MELEAIHKQLIKLCASTELPQPGELQPAYDELTVTLNKLIEVEGDWHFTTVIDDSQRLKLLANLSRKIANSNGGYVDDCVGFASFPNEGIGLRAESGVKAGQLLLKIGRNQMLTQSDALNCTAWQASRLSLDAMCQRMPNACLALYLLHHKLLGNESNHADYIHCLPTSSTSAVCLTLTSENFSLLSSQLVLRERIFTELRNCCKQYLYFYRVLSQLNIVGDELKQSMPLIKPGNFTFAAYRWAVAMVMSRNNVVPLGGEDGDSTAAGTLGLVPLWDMGNHRFGQMSTDYSPEEQCLLFYAMEDAPAGSQLYFMYGQRSNANLFLYAGIVIGSGDNPYDSADLKLGINPKDRLIEAKAKQLNALGLERSQQFCLPVSEPLTASLLAFARLVCAQSEPEVALAVSTDSTDDVGKDLNRRAGLFLVNRCRLLSMSTPTKDVDGANASGHCQRFITAERNKFEQLAKVFQQWTDQFN